MGLTLAMLGWMVMRLDYGALSRARTRACPLPWQGEGL